MHASGERFAAHISYFSSDFHDPCWWILSSFGGNEGRISAILICAIFYDILKLNFLVSLHCNCALKGQEVI